MNVARVRIAIRTFLSQKAGLLSNCITVEPRHSQYNGHAICWPPPTIATVMPRTLDKAVFIDTDSLSRPTPRVRVIRDDAPTHHRRLSSQHGQAWSVPTDSGDNLSRGNRPRTAIRAASNHL